MGKLQKNAMKFIKGCFEISGVYQWHYFCGDSMTRRVIKSLVKRGLVKINDDETMFRGVK